MTKRSAFLTGLVFVIGCELVGVLGSVVTASEISTWYAALEKPSFTPPGWVFGPVWTTLYALIGIAGAQIWQSKSKQRRSLLTLYFAQLFLNGIWSPIFFGAHEIGLALAVIFLLDITVIVLTVQSWNIVPRASRLLLPYLAWILLATAISTGIVILNG